MNGTETPAPPLSERNLALAQNVLRTCGYQESFIETDYAVNAEQSVSLVAFAHRPLDARSACIAVLPGLPSIADAMDACHLLGAPLFFAAGDGHWEIWSMTNGGPRFRRPLPIDQVERYFTAHKDDFSPGAVFRAKTWARAGVGRQLDFVDAGLLPLVEAQSGERLVQLFHEMVDAVMAVLGWKKTPADIGDAHWLAKSNFWLLAAKLLRDKNVPAFASLNLEDVREVFSRVSSHYRSPEPVSLKGRLSALKEAAKIAKNFASLRTLSVETLGALYERALLTRETRSLLGTHRTPTYLVDYMLAKLGDSMDDLGVDNCKIFEPACGHAPFLVGAIRKLSDMLRGENAINPDLRRKFLREHVRGSDNDLFALEIARLSLTLADIPNDNGWIFDSGDMFKGDYLAKQVAASTVIFANPPFKAVAPGKNAPAVNGDLRPQENGQAAEFFRRVLQSMRPGTIFGFVLPQTLLESPYYVALRRELLASCTVSEISAFPDNMFEFASVETAIVLGRKAGRNTSGTPQRILFRRVREKSAPEFERCYAAPVSVVVEASRFEGNADCRLILPELYDVWDACRELSVLSDVAEVGQGFSFRSTDGGLPDGAYTFSRTKQISTQQRGWLNVTRYKTHELPKAMWLNLDPRVISARRHGAIHGEPQVVINYSPISRGQWRLKAVADYKGHPATSRFLLLRPSSTPWSVDLLWALLNSPLANAYAYAHTGKRDIRVSTMRKMPVPNLDLEGANRVVDAARKYLEAASAYASRIERAENRARRYALDQKRKAALSERVQPLLFSFEIEEEKTLVVEVGNDKELAEATRLKQHLRTLQWRVDAEVIRLYNFPEKLQRELLDLFTGVVRLGVAFEQREFIPSDLKGVNTLDEFLRITDEWPMLEERRTALLERKFDHGLDSSEEAELLEMRRLLTLRRKFLRPFPSPQMQELFQRVLAKTEERSV